MTSPDLLYRIADIATLLGPQLDAELPAGVAVHANVLPVKATAPYVLLTARAPRLQGPMMAGDQTNEITVGAVSVGVNHDQAVKLGDQLRALLTGRDGRGAFLLPLTLAGRAVLQRASNDDGAPDLVGGVPQWNETYQLTLGRAGA